MHETDFPLAAQMAVHILAMSVAAPLLILLLRRSGLIRGISFGGLALATTIQLAALWIAHAPALPHALQGSTAGMLLVHAALFLIALWFWQEVLAAGGDRRWQAILALLITAKLFCLLGALIVFAPRAFLAPLAEQQAAGLLMLVACPITYLLAAGLIARRWLLQIEARPAQLQP
jgi:putative membrane protein